MVTCFRSPLAFCHKVGWQSVWVLLLGFFGGCTSSPTHVAAPLGTWYLTELDERSVAAAPTQDGAGDGSRNAPVLLTLEAPSKLYGFGGVNRFFGSYLSGPDGAFRVLGVSSTRRAGSPAAMELEALLLARLSETTAARAEAGSLELRADGRVLLRFQSAGP